MLRVTIELFPFGDETKKSIIRTIDIANNGTGDSVYGNYDARTDADMIDTAWKKNVVKHHHRFDGAEILVGKVIKELYE